MKWRGYWKYLQVDTMNWYPPHLVVGCLVVLAWASTPVVQVEVEPTVVELKLAAKQQAQASPPAHDHDRKQPELG